MDALSWFREVLASVVVFLVALPLCMGVAIASGVPPAMGLVSGIIGGIVVGTLAGSPLQVSGPAAGLAVIAWEIVDSHGVGGLAAATLLAGIVQVAAGKLRLGYWFRAVAPAVLYGMLSGIGVLIFASQFHVMVDDEPHPSGLVNLLTIPMAVWKGITEPEEHRAAAAIGLLTLAALVGWSTLRQRLGPVKVVPPPLVAVGLAVGAASLFGLDVRYVTVPDQVVDFIRLPTLDDLSQLLGPALFGKGLALAAVASAESMLCASAVDKIHGGERSDLDRELVAQGVGNTVAGVLGALPITGVIVRSTANVDAGATTRWSAVLHGVWLLAMVALLPAVLALVPVAALAAVLVYIGTQLVRPRIIRDLAAQGRAELGVYVATVVAIVATSLLEGLLVGLALAIGKVAWTFSNLEVEIEGSESGCVEVTLHGAATFVRLPYLTSMLEHIPDHAPVHVHTAELTHIDHACIEAIDDWARLRHARAGGTVLIQWEELHARKT